MKRIISIIMILALMLSINWGNPNYLVNAETTVTTESVGMEITAQLIPKNGSDSTHLMCGSAMQLTAEVTDNSTVTDKKIKWNVYKEDGTSMQAAYKEYETEDGKQGIILYAPYEKPENLIIKACIEEENLYAVYPLQTVADSSMTGETYFRFDLGDKKGETAATQEVWNPQEGTYEITLPEVTGTEEGSSFAGWLDSENNLHQAGEIIKRTYGMNSVFEKFTAQWKSAEETASSAVKEIEIIPAYLATNGSDEHNILWGSDIALYAKVLLEDGTVATGDNKEVTWIVEKTDGTATQSVQKEYSTKENFPAIRIYAPYGYEEELIVKTVSKADSRVVGIYELSVTGKSKLFNDYTNGETYFNFSVNKPAGTTVVGDAPTFTEEWNVEDASYTVVIPENNYQIEGYEFEGWKGKDGKLYQAGETVTVRKEDYSSVWYTFYASWKDLNPVTAPKKATISAVKRNSAKKATIKWKKISGAEGYQVVYSTKSSFKGAKTKNVSKSKNSYVIKGLKKSQTYYVKVRAYKKDRTGQKVTGSYSKVKKIKKWK